MANRPTTIRELVLTLDSDRRKHAAKLMKEMKKVQKQVSFKNILKAMPRPSNDFKKLVRTLENDAKRKMAIRDLKGLTKLLEKWKR